MLSILSVIVILFRFVTLSSAQPNFVNYQCNNTYGNYTSNSTYQQNLNTLLSTISSNTQITFGFYNFSVGKDPDIVNGIALCRGDVLLPECRSCLKNATTMLSSLCTNQKLAIGWYDRCMLRYSDQSIFGVMELGPWYRIRGRYITIDQNDFNRVLSNMFGVLQAKAVAGNSTLKFGIGQANVSSSLTLYAYAQCTPDLSQSDCQTCVSASISTLAGCCLSYTGARVFRASCNVRYEVFKFSNVTNILTFETSEATSPTSPSRSSPTPPTSALSSSPTSGRGKGSTASTIGIVVGVTVVCLLLVIIFCIFLRQRRKGKKANSELGLDDDITSFETLNFAYDDIKDATENFAEANKLGRGGFGIVYKGLLENGQQIAVKRLSRNSGQGEAEFRTEVLLVAKLQHRNLVRLLGFSLAGDERLLIYEYVPNASLDHFLFGNTRHEPLDWHIRCKIIGGIARGLLYLHEDSRLRIIHRDLKASNILLDAHLNPKIADFGLARLFQADQTHANTKIIAGTFGYMAPEYAYHGVFSAKSDVYSFGVLVLEIICGQKNSGFQEAGYMKGLVASVWRNWTEGKAFDLVDSALVSASRTEIMRCIHISLLCVQADPGNRPTMSLVNLMLSSESHSLPLPSEPAFVVQTNLAVDSPALPSIVEEESITELYGR